MSRPRFIVLAEETGSSKSTRRIGLKSIHHPLWRYGVTDHDMSVIRPDTQGVKQEIPQAAGFLDRSFYHPAFTLPQDERLRSKQTFAAFNLSESGSIFGEPNRLKYRRSTLPRSSP